MNIPSPHTTPTSSTISSSFPPFTHPEPSALSASPALPSSLLSSLFLRVLCGRSRILAILAAILAVFAATVAILAADLAVFAAIIATFAAHRQRHIRQTRLNSRSGRRTRPLRIEKRQKRQCSPFQSTLPSTTAAPPRISRLHSPPGVARSSTSCHNVTAHADHCGQIRLSDPSASPDAGAGETSPAAKSHNAWDTFTSAHRGVRGSPADQPQSVSVRCSPNGCRPGYSFLISFAGYHQPCAVRLACAISDVLMPPILPLQIPLEVIFSSRLRISVRPIWPRPGYPSG